MNEETTNVTQQEAEASPEAAPEPAPSGEAPQTNEAAPQDAPAEPARVPDVDTDDIENLSQEDLEAIYQHSMQSFREGEVVRGVVVELMPDYVLVDIGYKSEGIVPVGEFSDPSEVKVGDEFDVYIEEPEDDEGMPVLSKHKADKIKNWTHIQQIYEEDGIITGRIQRRVKGGLKVDIGIDAFMPASQLTWRPTSDLERYIGESMEMKIIKLTKRRRNVVVSRRKLLEEQRAEEKGKLLDTIAVGQVIEGEVKNITDFGAFVDVGGIDGLLHVTDMSWGRVKHPSHVVSVGQRIEVMVLSFDPDTERISLGLKQKSDNPWQTVVERYPIGGVVQGKVVSMTDYGAFVQLEEGIEGMVHVSEMSWTRRVRHPNEVVSLDDIVDVMVLNVDADNEKIALGLKQTRPNPWQDIESRYPVGSTVKGKVRNLTDYGAFIELEEGIDALLHISDISWTKKVNHPSEVLQKGQEIEVKVLNIDSSNEKIGVGLKQIETDPWDEMQVSHPVGSHVEVEIAKLVSFGAFARLENGIEGLIHVSELAQDRVQKPEEVLNVGDKVTAKVISLDAAERKIGLSIREYFRDLENKDRDDYHEQAEKQHAEAVSIGDAVGDALPKSMLSSGRTLADAAEEMMAAVRATEAAKEQEAQNAAQQQAPEPEAEASEPVEAEPAVEPAAEVEPAETPSTEPEEQAPSASDESASGEPLEQAAEEAPEEADAEEPKQS